VHNNNNNNNLKRAQCRSNLFFRLFTVGADTTSPGKEFHKFTARIADLHSRFCRFRLWPLVTIPESGTESGKNDDLLIGYIPCRKMSQSHLHLNGKNHWVYMTPFSEIIQLLEFAQKFNVAY